ncbi:MAG: hypothetical protein OSJ27_08780 [Candidatus Gastranaerophilales bacterium]|nr:hypothetical protein [Candidatus Gastranaerophilales bacterium]
MFSKGYSAGYSRGYSSIGSKQQLYEKNFSQTGQEAFENISLQSLFRKSRISSKQKEVANNYAIIKKIFSFSAVNSRITNSEGALLKQYGMKPLEETTAGTMFRELETLIDWTNNGDAIKRQHSDKIFEIRVKELKFLQANNSLLSMGELYNGYTILEKYIEYLAS